MGISQLWKDQRVSWDMYKSQLQESKYICRHLHKFLVCFNPTSTLLLLGYVFKPNNKECNSSFYQTYQQLVKSLIYLMISSYPNIGFAVVKYYWAELHLYCYNLKLKLRLHLGKDLREVKGSCINGKV